MDISPFPVIASIVMTLSGANLASDAVAVVLQNLSGHNSGVPVPHDPARHRRARLLRSLEGMHIISAERRSGGRCVLLVFEPACSATLAAIERAHSLIDHPMIPRCVHRGAMGDAAYLELDSVAIADGLEVVRRLGEAGVKVSYEAG